MTDTDTDTNGIPMDRRTMLGATAVGVLAAATGAVDGFQTVQAQTTPVEDATPVITRTPGKADDP